MVEIAFGKHRAVSPEFKAGVIEVSGRLVCDPSFLMAAMAFETGEKFTPDVRNATSGATGLIQFLPSTAVGLGTTTDALARMTAVAQLVFVEKHMHRFAGRMSTLSDVYMTILLPAAVGKPEAAVLFVKGTNQFDQNSGLDANKDGTITKAEASSKVHTKLIRGMSDLFRG